VAWVSDVYGPAVQFESADRFQQWIDEPSIIDASRGDPGTAAESGGVLSRVSKLVRG
jgi:hypothetical protein